MKELRNKILRKNFLYNIIFTTFSILMTFSLLTISKYTNLIITDIENDVLDKNNITIAIGLCILYILFDFVYYYIYKISELRAVKITKEFTLKKMIDSSLEINNKLNDGDVIYRINNISPDIASYYNSFYIMLILNFITIGSLLINICKYDFRIAIIVFSLFIINILSTYLYSKKISSYENAIEDQGSYQNSFLANIKQNIFEIKNMNASNNICLGFNSKALLPRFKTLKKKDFFYSLYVITYDILVLILPILILFIGFVFASNNLITIGAVLAIYSIIGAIQDPLRNIADSITYYKEIKIKKSKLSFVEKNNERFIDNIEINYIKVFGKGPNNLSYDLKFEKDKSYLIKGESGKGKSSIFNRIFKDTSFKDLYCTINDIDVSNISDQVLLEQIYYLKQSSSLLLDTFHNNICLYYDYSIEDLSKVLKVCNLTEFYSKHKDDIYFKDGKENISGGEKTRICLARALLSKKSFLLIDELSSSLDKSLSFDIAKNIYEYCNEKNITLIVISHKDEFDDLINNKIIL